MLRRQPKVCYFHLDTALTIITLALDPSTDSRNAEHLVLPRNEVISRLRERGEPILLFGETELDAFKRLRKCEISEPEVNRVCFIFTPK